MPQDTPITKEDIKTKYCDKCINCAFIAIQGGKNELGEIISLRAREQQTNMPSKSTTTRVNCFHSQFNTKPMRYLKDKDKCVHFVEADYSDDRTLKGIQMEQEEKRRKEKENREKRKDKFIIGLAVISGLVSITSVLITYHYSKKDDLSDSVWQEESSEQRFQIIEGLKPLQEIDKSLKVIKTKTSIKRPR